MLALVVLGGCLGYATTLLESDEPDAPVVTYWAAGVRLVRADDATTRLDESLNSLAVRMMGDEVIGRVAD